MQKHKDPQLLTLSELKIKWNSFAPIYSIVDNSMNSFFYQLIHMLRLDSASCIYEVGCGTGRLIPYILSLKKRQAKYVAIDISQTMINLATQTIKNSLMIIPKEIDFQDYLKWNNLALRCSDGQKQAQNQAPFDRILCNLVLMLTQDPQQMMRTFYKQAQNECLLGVTVLGNTKLANNFFLQIPQKIRMRLQLPPSKQTKNHVLYDKLKELGNKTGWELIVQWDQLVPFSFFQVDQNLKNMLKQWKAFSEGIQEELLQQIRKIFQKRQTLTFPGRLAIYKKRKQAYN